MCRGILTKVDKKIMTVLLNLTRDEVSRRRHSNNLVPKLTLVN